MKVAFLSTSDLDGGGARATSRLLSGLRRGGVDAEMWVQRRLGSSSWVKQKRFPGAVGIGRGYTYLDALPKLFYPHRERGAWTTGFWPNPLFPGKALRGVELLHLHWVSQGFVPIKALAHVKQPVVWTLHDMAPFTGGCHYTGDCEKFREHCGSCPILGSKHKYDISRLSMSIKEKAWDCVDMMIVCPSRWLADQAERSLLFGERCIEVIPNGLDLDVYRPIDKVDARIQLGLPHDTTLLMIAAMNVTGDRRKGYHHMHKALCRLDMLAGDSKIEVLVAGTAPGLKSPFENIKIRSLGSLSEESDMVLTYSAADLFIAPSEQDNLPNTIMEAMACGTPVVAFHVGGIPELIDHEQNGMLVPPFDVNRLADVILQLVRDDVKRKELGMAAVDKVGSRFELGAVVRQYTELYDAILTRGASV